MNLKVNHILNIKKKITIFCSIKEKYLELIEENLKEFLGLLNIDKYNLKSYKDWEITLLHSHLCGSIFPEYKLKKRFKSK